MKTTYLDMKKCVGMLERHNPLLVRDEAGCYLLFETWGMMYVWVLERMMSLFPRGYVDMRLLLYELTGLDKDVCDGVVRMSRLPDARRGFVMVEWADGDAQRFRSLELLVTLLHRVTQTLPDRRWLVWAVGKFDEAHGFGL